LKEQTEMTQAKRSLKQIAIDMRAAGEMLIEGAAEIEAAGTLLESVNLDALAALLGGGAVAPAPFDQQSRAAHAVSVAALANRASSASTPAAPSPARATPEPQEPPEPQGPPRRPGPKPGSQREEHKLSKEEKQRIRERWARLPQEGRTDGVAAAMAQEYKTTRKYIKNLVNKTPEMLREQAARARASKAALAGRRSTETAATPTRPN
jgi:hypothetical protein